MRCRRSGTGAIERAALHTHTHTHTVGHTETGPARPTTEDDDVRGQIVVASRVRSFVRSIERSRASIATATVAVRRSTARGDVEEDARGVDVVAVVPIEPPRVRTTRRA